METAIKVLALLPWTDWAAIGSFFAGWIGYALFARRRSNARPSVLAASNDLPDNTKLVVLSNYATSDMRRKCFELGADQVFDKSNEIDALISYCQRLAAGEATTGHGAL